MGSVHLDRLLPRIIQDQIQVIVISKQGSFHDLRMWEAKLEHQQLTKLIKTALPTQRNSYVQLMTKQHSHAANTPRTVEAQLRLVAWWMRLYNYSLNQYTGLAGDGGDIPK